MNVFRDKSPGLGRGRFVVWLIVCAIAIGAIVVLFTLPDQRIEAKAAIIVPAVMLYIGIGQPWERWGRCDLVVDGDGVHFGMRGRQLPFEYAGPGKATHYPLFVPWGAVRSATLVGPAGSAELVAAAGTFGQRWWQASKRWGFFPSGQAKHHLVLTIDPAAVIYPTVSDSEKDLEPSSEWVLPVRDLDGLRQVFAGAPVPLTEQR